MSSGPSPAGNLPLPRFRKVHVRARDQPSPVESPLQSRESSGCCGLQLQERACSWDVSRWQAAPLWALLAKSAAQMLQLLPRVFHSWLCCCVSDQLQNLPAGQQALPAPLSQLGCPAGTFWAGDSPVELRGWGRSSVLWHWVSLMALWHCHPSKASQEGGWSSSAGKHSTRLHRALGGGQGQGESGAGEEGGAQPQQLQRDIPCAAGCFCGT